MNMIRNYLKIAFRSLRKSKGFTALNFIGLASGLAVCLLIVLYVTDELSYDRYNVNADRIYRVDADSYSNNTQYDATISKFFRPALVASYPKIQQMVRFCHQVNQLVRKGNDHIPDHHFVFADSTIFQVFTLPMIAGDPNTALNNPHSIVIDESVACRHFNSTDVVAALIAFPAVWWAMYKWLDTFAYRTEISWWNVLWAGAAALSIALLTVSIQTIRAALANPVKSHRSE